MPIHPSKMENHWSSKCENLHSLPYRKQFSEDAKLRCSLTLGGITAHMSERRRRVSGSFGLVDGQILRLAQIKSAVNLFFICQFSHDMLPVMTEEFGFTRYEDSFLGW